MQLYVLTSAFTCITWSQGETWRVWLHIASICPAAVTYSLKNFWWALHIGMLITEGILLTAEICKNCFFTQKLPHSRRGGRTYSSEDVMFNIYRNDVTRFLYAKIQKPRTKELYNLSSGFQPSQLPFDSKSLLLPPLPNTKAAPILRRGEMVLWDSNLPSPQFAAALRKKVPFLAHIASPQFIGLPCGKQMSLDSVTFSRLDKNLMQKTG